MTDYLTQLPVELFKKVCEFVHEAGEGPYLALVSKTFVSLAREHLFGGTVYVTTPGSLTVLVDVLINSPSAAAAVKNLTVSVLTTSDAGQPDTETFLKALANLTSLNTLELGCATRLCEAVLQPARDGLLPSPEALGITSRLDGWGNPYSPMHYSRLGVYPNPWHLSLDIHRPAHTLWEGDTAPLSLARWPDSLQWLDLRGYIVDNPSSTDLINRLGNRDGLSLSDVAAGLRGSMTSLLENVSSPSNLSSLGLRQNSIELEDISSVLPAFTSLTMTEFGGGIAISPLLPVLAVLPDLERLWFGDNSPVSGADLDALVDGDFKVKHLERLVLHSNYSSDLSVGDVARPIARCEELCIVFVGDTISFAHRYLAARMQR